MAPLDGYLEKWPFSKDMVPEVISFLTYDGHQVGLPYLGVTIRDLVYRADMFAEAGLPPEEPPRNWDELVSYGKRLVRFDSEGKMTRSAIQLGLSDQTFSMFHHQNGGELLKDGVPQLTTEAAVSALRFLVDLIHTHQLMALGFGGSLAVGTTAMAWERPVVFWRENYPTEELWVATFPYSHQPATFMGMGFIAMSRSAVNVSEAVALLEYLLHPDRQEVINQYLGFVPFYYQAREWDWVQANPVMMHFMQALSYGVPNPPHEKWFEIRQVLREAVSAAVKQEQPPETALRQANELIGRIVSE